MSGHFAFGMVLALYDLCLRQQHEAGFLVVRVSTGAGAQPMQGTVVRLDKQNNRLVVKTAEGEKALVISNNTLGLEHAIEGAEVRIEYHKQGDTLTASEINPSKSGDRG